MMELRQNASMMAILAAIPAAGPARLCDALDYELRFKRLPRCCIACKLSRLSLFCSLRLVAALGSPFLSKLGFLAPRMARSQSCASKSSAFCKLLYTGVLAGIDGL